MIENFTKADADYGRRVAEGLKNAMQNIGEVGAPSGATKTEEGVDKLNKFQEKQRLINRDIAITEKPLFAAFSVIVMDIG